MISLAQMPPLVFRRAQEHPLGHSLLLQIPDHRSLLQRVASAFQAEKADRADRLLRPSSPFIPGAARFFPRLDETGSYRIVPFSDQTDPNKIVVLIHGLFSSPLSWSWYLPEIWKRNPKIRCFVPEVRDRGNCRIDKAAQPILEFIKNYHADHPRCEIKLIGHSRGAKIAAHIMRELQDIDLSLISIAGPHGGSKMMTAIDYLGATDRLGLDRNVAEESRYLGEVVVKHLTDWKGKQDPRVKVFMTATEDRRIFPYLTCCPNLCNSAYFGVQGQSHAAIIHGVRPLVVEAICRFSESQKLDFWKHESREDL